MKVLVVTPWFPSEDSPGAGIFNLRDVELLSRDHEVSVIHLVDPVLPTPLNSWQTEHGVKVSRVPFAVTKPATWRGASVAITQAMKRADIVHSMAFSALLPVRLATRTRATRNPWIHTEHWSALLGVGSNFRKNAVIRVMLPLLKHPDRVVAVSEQLATVLRTAQPVGVDVIGNRVMLAPVGSLPVMPADRKHDPLILMGVGNLVPHKDPLLAVETLAELNRRGIDSRLQWAGVGALSESFQERARELNVLDKVVQLGLLSPEQLSAELLHSHLFFLPTRGETFGVALAEALGHGLPVVATGTGGHESFLPKEASRLVHTRTPAALADAIEDLLADSQLWSAERSAAYAREKFSEETRQKEYAEAYHKALHHFESRGR